MRQSLQAPSITKHRSESRPTRRTNQNTDGYVLRQQSQLSAPRKAPILRYLEATVSLVGALQGEPVVFAARRVAYTNTGHGRFLVKHGGVF